MVNILRAWLRMLGLVTSIVLYLLWFYLLLVFKKDQLKWGLKLRWSWMKLAHWILGLKVEVEGDIPDKAGLVACNHQAAIDPLVVMRFIELFPVGKYEIRSYPLIGFAAEKTGILFVKREVRDHRRAVRKKIGEHLKSGRSILVFPEGTVSSDGNLLPFRAGSFGSAMQAGAMVYPVAIAYGDEKDRWQQEDSLYRHFVKQAGKAKTRIRITFCQPLEVKDPEEAALETAQRISNALKESDERLH
jgi:1-acyl-sn-glycerol-3-phosphate acyltransferase